MKKTFLILSASLSIFILSGCLQLEGFIKAHKDVRLNDDSAEGSYVLEAGSETAVKIEKNSDDLGIDVVIETGFFKTGTHHILFKTKINLENLKNGDTGLLRAKENGQPYNAEYKFLETTSAPSALIKKTEDCSELKNSKDNLNSIFVKGSRYVEFYTTTVTKTLKVKLTKISGELVATLSADHSDSNPTYVRSDACVIKK